MWCSKKETKDIAGIYLAPLLNLPACQMQNRLFNSLICQTPRALIWSYTLYGSDSLLLPTPRTNFMKRTFHYRGGRLWNNLPSIIKISATLPSFKKDPQNSFACKLALYFLMFVHVVFTLHIYLGTMVDQSLD